MAALLANVGVNTAHRIHGRLLSRAVPFRRQETEATLGAALRCPAHRTEQQTIRSRTRAGRLTGRPEGFLRELCRCPS